MAKWTIIVTRVQIVEGVEIDTDYDDAAIQWAMKNVKPQLKNWNSKTGEGVTELWQAYPTPENVQVEERNKSE